MEDFKIKRHTRQPLREHPAPVRAFLLLHASVTNNRQTRSQRLRRGALQAKRRRFAFREEAKRGRFAYAALPTAHFERNDITITCETVHQSCHLLLERSVTLLGSQEAKRGRFAYIAYANP
jgi:hypothetical protein